MGIIMQPGQRCTYQIAKNFDTSRGTFSCWVKPLNWSGQDTKFRHFLAADAGPGYSMLVYLYPCGDVSVWNYIQVGANTPHAATWRAGGPVDMFKRNQWTHLATTWDAKAVRLFANGRRLSEALVAAPLPKLQTGTFTICPVEFWKNELWGDPKEQTVCDEVRIFDRALADDEILDLYAEDCARRRAGACSHPFAGDGATLSDEGHFRDGSGGPSFASLEEPTGRRGNAETYHSRSPRSCRVFAHR